MYCIASFPGHSHLQSFDRLQYVNMDGEGLGDLFMCGDISKVGGRVPSNDWLAELDY